MKTLKALFTLFILLALGIGGVSVAVAAATGPAALPNSPATLSVTSDTVQLKKSGSETWVTVTEDTSVTIGDSVWTNTTGSATINFFDQGIIRLDADTSITITNATWDAEQPDVFNGSIFLETGQLWSRLFDFLSPESSYEVKTPSTVATVRGTIFSVTEGSGMTSVYVDQHQVFTTSRGESEEVLAGESLAVDPNAAKLMTKKAIDPALRAWIEKNRGEDKDFDLAALKKLRSHLRSNGRFQRFAENARLAATFNDETYTNLSTRFRLRQLLLERIRQISEGELPPDLEERIRSKIDANLESDSAPTIEIDGLLENAVQVFPVSLHIQTDITEVVPGQSITLSANARMSDGTFRNATDMVTWTLVPSLQSTAQVDSLKLNTFTGMNPGTATVKIFYDSANVYFSDMIEITVTKPVTINRAVDQL